MRALFQITDQGRAAGGRRLAARAVLVQFVGLCALFACLAAIAITAGHDMNREMAAVAMSGLFYLFVLYAFARGWVLIGVLYGLYALSGFFSIGNTASWGTLYAFAGLITGILNFVAISGIVIWLRNRNSTSPHIA